jgi:hypothetical protein
MAGSIAPSDFILLDNFPGVASPNTPMPTGGFAQKDTSALYPVGTKITKYQDNSVGAQGSSVANKGYYTMMYTAMYDYTNAADASEGRLCQLACGSAKARGGIFVTLDTSGGQNVQAGKNYGPVAIPCVSFGFSFASPEYGWFWVGGVCPNHDLSGCDITGYLIDATDVDGGTTFGIDYDATTIKFGILEATQGTRAAFALGDASA